MKPIRLLLLLLFASSNNFTCIRQWERKALGGRISQRGVVSGVPVERGWRLVAGGGPYLFRLCFALA